MQSAKDMTFHAGGFDPRSSLRAFTLIELMLVAAIMVMMAGTMAPRVSRSYRSLELRGSVQELVATMRMAAETAIRSRAETRLVFEQGGDSFWLEVDDLSSPSEKMTRMRERALGEKRALPDGMTIQLEDRNGQSPKELVRYLSFFPDGSRTPGLIEVADRRDRKRWIRVGQTLGTIQVLKEKPDVRSP